MALNFPTTSTTGTVYTEGNRSWTWNGRFWQASSTTVGYTGSTGTQGVTGFTVKIQSINECHMIIITTIQTKEVFVHEFIEAVDK